jgi:hypothetical protein
MGRGATELSLRSARVGLAGVALVTAGLVSCSDILSAGASTAPTAPTALVCGNASVLSGPASAPAGAVTVAAGDNSATVFDTPNTTYWLAPGVHTLGTGEFDQIIPADGDTYVGGPGAVLDGQDENDFAFTQQATGVTIRYLTIENFVAAQDQGVVNHDSGTGWSVENDTIEGTKLGAGLMLGSDSVTTNDCLTNNGQYGFNGYSAAGDADITLTDNEISYNDAAGYDLPGGPGGDGCGCGGGGKFWATSGGVVTGNYVHNNNDPGLWADTDNTGFDISDNYIANNGAEGIMYEIGYNASITDNTLVDNGWTAGPANPGFPTAALYISESGGDARVPGPYSGQFTVSGNLFSNNWGGVVLWENANRFCSDGSDDVCTLVDPSLYTLASCGAHLATSTPTSVPDYFDNCRWKTQNVEVSDNTFDFDPAAIGAACTLANSCGFNGLFSEYGSSAPYVGWVVPENISNNQDNHFADNTYNGPWNFIGFEQGDTVTSAQWTAGFDDQNGSGDHFNAQDAGSTFNGTVETPLATATSVLIPATGAKLSGTAATLDASGSNATSVEFWIFGGSYGFTGKMLCTATATEFGWVCRWNTTTIPNGSYALTSEAFNSVGHAFSPGVNITVKN